MAAAQPIPDFKPMFKNGIPLPSALKQCKGGTFVALTLNDVPLTSRGYGDRMQTSMVLLVVKVERAGFARVPQEERKGKYVVPDSAQHLTEVLDQTDASGKTTQVLKCFAFETIEGYPKDKGPRRNEVTHQITPGMILRQSLFADRARGGEKYDKKLVPLDDKDVLPAFSVVTVEWNVKGWTKWMEGEINPVNNKPMKACPPSCGYGGTVTQFAMVPGVTAYSLLPYLAESVPSTVSECQQKQRGFLASNRTIENMVVQQNACCFVEEIGKEGFITYNDAKRIVNINNWSSSVAMPIDIDLDAALRHTNSSSVDECCKILELFMLAGSLSAMMYYNEYRVKPTEEDPSSPYCGIPLLRVEKMFKALATAPLTLDKSKQFAVVSPEWKLPDDNDQMIDSEIHVTITMQPDGEAKANVGCPDLCITSCDADCIRKGYGVAIVRGDVPCWAGRCVELGGANTFLQKAEKGAAELRKRWIAGSAAKAEPQQAPKAKKAKGEA